MPSAITAIGGKVWGKDNTETADTMTAVYQYPDFMMTYELRQSCATPMFGQGGATGIMGTKGMVVLTRRGCWLNPNKDSELQPVEFLHSEATRQAPGQDQPQVSDHWKDFLNCIRTRQKPVSDIENLVKSSAVCVLGNVAMRANVRLDFDEKTFKVRQPEAEPFTRVSYRAPWKLEV